MLANQMHGLENQAKRANWTPAKSAVDILSLNSSSSRGSASSSSPSADLKDRKLGASASEPDLKRGGGAEGRTKEEQEEVKAGEEEEVDAHPELREEDEDKFYDAPEADDSMVAFASGRTHARNESAGSMNDMQAMEDMSNEGEMRPFSAKNAMMVCDV